MNIKNQHHRAGLSRWRSPSARRVARRFFYFFEGLARRARGAVDSFRDCRYSAIAFPAHSDADNPDSSISRSTSSSNSIGTRKLRILPFPSDFISPVSSRFGTYFLFGGSTIALSMSHPRLRRSYTVTSFSPLLRFSASGDHHIGDRYIVRAGFFEVL
jgi:hypothetical protein